MCADSFSVFRPSSCTSPPRVRSRRCAFAIVPEADFPRRCNREDIEGVLAHFDSGRPRCARWQGCVRGSREARRCVNVVGLAWAAWCAVVSHAVHAFKGIRLRSGVGGMGASRSSGVAIGQDSHIEVFVLQEFGPGASVCPVVGRRVFSKNLLVLSEGLTPATWIQLHLPSPRQRRQSLPPLSGRCGCRRLPQATSRRLLQPRSAPGHRPPTPAVMGADTSLTALVPPACVESRNLGFPLALGSTPPELVGSAVAAPRCGCGGALAVDLRRARFAAPGALCTRSRCAGV